MRSLESLDHNISKVKEYSTPADQDIDIWLDWALIDAQKERGGKWLSGVSVSVCTKRVYLRVPEILCPWQRSAPSKQLNSGFKLASNPIQFWFLNLKPMVNKQKQTPVLVLRGIGADWGQPRVLVDYKPELRMLIISFWIRHLEFDNLGSHHFFISQKISNVNWWKIGKW